MKRRFAFFCILALLGIGAAWYYWLQDYGSSSGDARADLESPSPQVRERAAKILRTIAFIPTPRKRWETFLAPLPGHTREEVAEILAYFHPEPRGGYGNFAGDFEGYQLDDGWALGLHYPPYDGPKLIEATLTSSIRVVVPKSRPPDYTGKWTIYFADGQPAYDWFYENGKETGSLFHPHP